MKKLNLTLATMAAVTLIGCGGGGGSSSSNGGTNSDGTAEDGLKIVKVTYTINGSDRPICNKPFLITGLESSSEQIACHWLCGEYEGARPVDVTLRFRTNGGIWQFESDSVSTAVSCHD